MTPVYRTWSNEKSPPAERLVAFQDWLGGQLAQRLVWPRDPAAMRKQVGQCQALIMTAVADLGKHGYLFRPRELAAHLIEAIDRIADYQRRSQVKDLYAYFRSAWDNWVGRNAEELQQSARQDRVYAPAATEIQHARTIPELALIAEKAKRESRTLAAGARAVRKTRKALRDVDLLPGFGGR